MSTYRREPPIQTSTGLLIGGAYIPPPPRMSDDAEKIQAVLLDSRRPDSLSRTSDRGHQVALVIGVMILVGFCVAALVS